MYWHRHKPNSPKKDDSSAIGFGILRPLLFKKGIIKVVLVEFCVYMVNLVVKPCAKDQYYNIIVTRL